MPSWHPVIAYMHFEVHRTYPFEVMYSRQFFGEAIMTFVTMVSHLVEGNSLGISLYPIPHIRRFLGM